MGLANNRTSLVRIDSRVLRYADVSRYMPE